MAALGLVPSESSSGGKRHQGAITKTGNGHARKILVESAWNYRYPARISRPIELRQRGIDQEVTTIAWNAQKRLCTRYQHLMMRGKNKKLATTDKLSDNSVIFKRGTTSKCQGILDITMNA